MVAVTTRLEMYGRYAPSTSRSRNMFQEQRVERSIVRHPVTRDLVCARWFGVTSLSGLLGLPQNGVWRSASVRRHRKCCRRYRRNSCGAERHGGLPEPGPRDWSALQVVCLSRQSWRPRRCRRGPPRGDWRAWCGSIQPEPPDVEHLSLGPPRPGRRRDPRLRGAADGRSAALRND